MDEGLKKRLLGAAVLASLVVIFVPMLIEEPADLDPQIADIPPPPEIEDFSSSMLREEIVRPPPAPLEILQEQPEPTDEPSSAAAPPAEPSAVAEGPGDQASAVPRAGLTAWIVKVGSFSNQENALKLVAKLRDAGFQTPDPKRVEVRGKTLYRVLVGPMVQQEKARRLLPEVNKVSGTEGLVTRYH